MSFTYDENEYSLTIDISGLNVNYIDIETLSGVLPYYNITSSGYINYNQFNYISLSSVIYTSNFLNVDYSYYSSTISSFILFNFLGNLTNIITISDYILNLNAINYDNYENNIISLSGLIKNNYFNQGLLINNLTNNNNYQNIYLSSLSGNLKNYYFNQGSTINNLTNNNNYQNIYLSSLSGYTNQIYYNQGSTINNLSTKNNYQDLFIKSLSGIVNNYYYNNGNLLTYRATKLNPYFTGNINCDGYIRWAYNDMKIETRFDDTNRYGVCLDENTLRIYTSNLNLSSRVAMGFSTGLDLYNEYFIMQHNGDIDIMQQLNVGSLFSNGVILGGNINSNGTITATDCNLISYTESISPTTGSLIVSGGVGIFENCNIGGRLKIYSYTKSIDQYTGAIVCSGGVGISGSFNVGGRTQFYNTVESTNFNDASVVMYGGCNVKKNLRVQGSIYSVGDIHSYGSIRSASRYFINYNLNSGGSVQTIFNSPGVYIYTFGANYEDTNITCTTFVTFGTGLNICRLYNQNIPPGFNLTLTPVSSQTFTISATYPAGGYNYLSVDFVRLTST